MSVEQMSIVWKKEVPSNRLGMLLALADHAHDDGSNVYPSAAHLAWKVGMSERHVRTVLKELHGENVLIKVKQATPQHPTVWRLNLDALADKRSWEEVREEHLTAKRSRGSEPRAEETSAQTESDSEESRAEDSATHGRKSVQFRAEVQSSAEPSLGTVIEPSGSVEKTSFSTGEAAEQSSDGPPKDEVKPQDPKQYGVAQLMERVNAARERGASLHSPTNDERKDFGKQFAQCLKDGYDMDTLLLALDYQVTKAAGEVEGEPKAWCGYRTALDRVNEGWMPAQTGPPATDPEQQALAAQNRRDALKLIYGDDVPTELRSDEIAETG